MLDSLFYIAVGVGILLLGFSAADKDEVTWPILGFIFWIIAAIGAFGIEHATSYVVENASSPTGYSVVEEITNYAGGWPFGVLFFGLALMMFIFAWNRILEQFGKAGGG